MWRGVHAVIQGGMISDNEKRERSSPRPFTKPGTEFLTPGNRETSHRNGKVGEKKTRTSNRRRALNTGHKKRSETHVGSGEHAPGGVKDNNAVREGSKRGEIPKTEPNYTKRIAITNDPTGLYRSGKESSAKAGLTGRRSRKRSQHRGEIRIERGAGP